MSYWNCDCGALDCPICHPENQEVVKCACCGEEHPIYELYDEDLHICMNCMDKVQCDYCGEWHDSDSDDVVNDDGIYYCKSCFEEITEQVQEREPLTAEQKQKAFELAEAVKQVEAMFAMN